MDANAQLALMKLIIAWLFIGVIVFTTFLTCLSLVVPEVFVVKAQQRWLFRILIVELIIGAVAMFLGFINPSTKAASKEITKPIEEENKKLNSDVYSALKQRDKLLSDNLAAQIALYELMLKSNGTTPVEQDINKQKALDDLRRKIELLRKQVAEQEKYHRVPLLEK